MNTVPKFAELLRRLQAARIAEADVFGELAMAITKTGSHVFPIDGIDGVSSSETEPFYLSVREVAARIPYAEQTIRNMMICGELREGEHYFKRRGRVMFSWPAMRAWVEQQTTREDEAGDAATVLPLVRNQRYGRSE